MAFGTLVGTWKAIVWQATWGVTPIRRARENDFPILEILPNGRGYATRKKLFGTAKCDLTWKLDDEKTNFYIVDIEDGGFVFIGQVDGDSYKAIYDSVFPGITGGAVTYERC